MGWKAEKLLTTSPKLFNGNIPMRLYHYNTDTLGRTVNPTIQPPSITCSAEADTMGVFSAL